MKQFLFGLIFISLFAIGLYFGGRANADDEKYFKIIPIPSEEHGYSNFESIVIATQDELDAFLAKGSNEQGMGWNNRAGFENALNAGALDFKKQALVLLRHTEGSGSTEIHFLNPEIKAKRLVARVERKEFEVGVDVVAFYCFALNVPKSDVTEVQWRVPGQKPVILQIPRNSD